MNRKEKYWSLTVGIYPGILLGYRGYVEEYFTTHVIYFPFFDIALEIEH
jgi:hypothetical protein